MKQNPSQDHSLPTTNTSSSKGLWIWMDGCMLVEEHNQSTKFYIKFLGSKGLVAGPRSNTFLKNKCSFMQLFPFIFASPAPSGSRVYAIEHIVNSFEKGRVELVRACVKDGEMRNEEKATRRPGRSSGMRISQRCRIMYGSKLVA
eukprot:scaffold34627_cov159-Amphora_coffeaeformis.AAC.4